MMKNLLNIVKHVKVICIICEDEHEEHNIIDYKKILIKNNDLLNTMKNLNDAIENFKFKIIYNII